MSSHAGQTNKQHDENELITGELARVSLTPCDLEQTSNELWKV